MFWHKQISEYICIPNLHDQMSEYFGITNLTQMIVRINVHIENCANIIIFESFLHSECHYKCPTIFVKKL